MTARHTYRVKEVSQISGVSVRALHHYDEIGLLTPKIRTRASYRLYDDCELLRLQRIMIGRELGLSLEQIRQSLDDPDCDYRAQLIEQRTLLIERAERTSRMIRAIDAALSTLDSQPGGDTMKEIFDGFDPSKVEAEAKTRWGETEAYKEAARRTKGYGPEDWKRIKAEQADVYEAAHALLASGCDPGADVAMQVAERHRLFVERWFYPCNSHLHEGLADLYESDRRFADNIDSHGIGITAFLSAAIRANARRLVE